MLLELGQRSFDLSSRALIAAPFSEPAEHADIVVAHECEQVHRFTRSHVVAIETTSATAAASALEVGATLVIGGALSDPQLLTVVADHDAAVAIHLPGQLIENPVGYLAERAGWAQAAGIKRSKIIIESPLTFVQELVRLQLPVMVSCRSPESAGAQVAALMQGARLLRCDSNVRQARRTAFTISELLTRRGIASPVSVGLGIDTCQ